jgi:hypothetical protein
MISSDANERMSEADKKRFEELFDQYIELAHSVQAGVGTRIELDPTFATKKDMRTGIDTQKADMSGLVNLLIMKGVFTDVEYMEAIVASMKQEKELWEAEISKMLGGKSVRLV